MFINLSPPCFVHYPVLSQCALKVKTKPSCEPHYFEQNELFMVILKTVFRANFSSNPNSISRRRILINKFPPNAISCLFLAILLNSISFSCTHDFVHFILLRFLFICRYSRLHFHHSLVIFYLVKLYGWPTS